MTKQQDLGEVSVFEAEPGSSQNPAVAIKVGQIWREVDPRFERHVTVTAIDETHATLLTVFRSGPNWVSSREYRNTRASLSRFNGKRGGYKLVSEV